MTIEYLRSFRLGEYAIFDLTISFLGMYLLAPWLSKLFYKIGVVIPKENWLFLTLPIGILIHLLIGKSTLMTRNFLEPQGSYGLKLFILVLVILGLRGTRLK